MKYLSLIITFFLIVITYSCDYDISDVAKIEIKSNKKIQDKIDSYISFDEADKMKFKFFPQIFLDVI